MRVYRHVCAFVIYIYNNNNYNNHYINMSLNCKYTIPMIDDVIITIYTTH